MKTGCISARKKWWWMRTQILLKERSQSDYKYGFVTDIEADEAPKGLNEDTIRFISAKKE